ncbi:hypothetical protein N7494_011922 [Penicillium frequentans]|uniref:Uncharacterized protein n=1 Tax=Penicillium frequentans TaxID=3151616 RepID=A0AAD6CNG0_9EURO|nr:hypothetical protein N7494_011922 [Penicillium glabrum]
MSAFNTFQQSGEQCTAWLRFTIERFDVYGQWEGVSGPGVVIIESVVRTENSDLPYSSQLTKAVYQHEFELKTLKFVFMYNVVNEETLRFVREFIYNEETYKDLDHIQEAPRKSFEKDTPQYHQLLGTRMGTRHIGRVVTWFQSYRLQLRFDID